MSVGRKILFGFVGLILVASIVVLMMPKDYEVERSIVIDAPVESIHSYVGDLKKWDDWTPWKSEDSTVKVTFGDKTTGVGASQSWTGKDGDGNLAFTMCDPATGIAYDMTFIMDGDDTMNSKCAISYSKSGDSTKLIWTMKGEMKGMAGGLFAYLMPSMGGDLFDRGLKKLKKIVEAKK